MREKVTENVSLRVEKDKVDILREESRTQGNSINGILNNIIDTHIKWQNPAAKAGFVPLPKQLLVKLMDQYSEEEVKEIADQISVSVATDILMILRGECSIDALVDLIKSWARASGFSHQFHMYNDTHKERRVVLVHNMGPKWSIYWAKLYENIIHSLGNKSVKSETTSEITILKIPEMDK